MVSRFCRSLWSLVVLLAVCSCTTAQEGSLRKFLQNYVGSPRFDEGKATRYFAAFVHLRDDNTRQAIVYLTNNGWCGSGGCTTLILEPQGSTYRVITKVMTTRPPIRVLNTKTNGWHDLAVRVQGGGVVHAYEAKLPFNGNSYPISPSMPAAQPLTTEIAGEVIVPTAVAGEPLYP
jgi:hypothetical protein